MNTVAKAVAVLLVGVWAGGCVSSTSGSAYSRSETRQAQSVEYGVVQNVQTVQIEGTKSNVGTGIGAVAGGVGGSAIGGGTRAKILGGLGGAVLGGAIGSMAEEGLTRETGLQITVRLDSGHTLAVTQAAGNETFTPGERVMVITGQDGTARVSH